MASKDFNELFKNNNQEMLLQVEQLNEENSKLREQLLQVRDYLGEEQGNQQQEMEAALSSVNLKYCEARAENDKLIYKLEIMQDKMIAMRKELKQIKKCPQCSPNEGSVSGKKKQVRRTGRSKARVQSENGGDKKNIRTVR